MLHALLYVPLHLADAGKWTTLCWVYCLRRGYNPKAVVRNIDDVRRLMMDHAADKVIVARPDHVEFLEFVSEQPGTDDPPSSQRRTGRM